MCALDITAYPGQSGIEPIPIKWIGAKTPLERGPVIVSRQVSTIKKRNSVSFTLLIDFKF
jgi:GTP cyclohydrolase N terminal